MVDQLYQNRIDKDTSMVSQTLWQSSGRIMNKIITKTEEWDLPVDVVYQVIPGSPNIKLSIKVISINLTPKGYKILSQYHADLAVKGAEE